MSILERVDSITLCLAQSSAIVDLIRRSDDIDQKVLANASAAAQHLIEKADEEVAQLWEEYRGEVQA